MEVEMLEDDVFFAELSKRISLLITDDDEADFGAAAAQFIPAAAPLPGFASLGHVPLLQQQGLAPPAYMLFHHAASYGGSAARAWQQQQRCGSKGTGVFIPRSTPGSAHSKKRGKKRGNAAANKQARAAAQAGTALTAGEEACLIAWNKKEKEAQLTPDAMRATQPSVEPPVESVGFD